MLPSLPTKSRGPLNPWVCAGINQFAWPGLGSIMGGRAVGFFQAALMLIGFVLFLGFMLVYFKNMWAWAANTQGTAEDFQAGYQPYTWARDVGLALCVISWIWSLITTVSLLRGGAPPPTLPPRLDEPPKIN